MTRFMPSMHAMRWALAALAVVVGALLGSHFGASRERARIDLAGDQTELAQLKQQYESELARVRTQRDIADASNQKLQDTVKQLQAASLEQKSTQRLYDRIEGIDQSSGLAVDTVTRITDADGNTIELHITVVQSRGRHRVVGQIGVALVGEKNDSNWREVIVSVDDDAAPRFDMRFFQTVVVPVPENNILIDFVEIDVKPEGKAHKPFTYEADWSSILED